MATKQLSAAQRTGYKTSSGATALKVGKPPGQTVLVLQGGGALGAYQLGVYQALHEAGVEPDWVVGTSIGAVNGAIIAGNPPAMRMARLQAFWDRMTLNRSNPFGAFMNLFGNAFSNMNVIATGVPGFFAPNPDLVYGAHAKLGIERAAYYTTDLLRETLSDLVDIEYLQGRKTRFTVGAVNARSGAMRYFDNHKTPLTIEHVMASGALPPAFPAVRIEGEPYWDGGIYSNTPVEVVLEDNPRKDSTIFAVQLWDPLGPEPESLWQINARQKDIQFSSRASSHIANQQKIHQLRHIIRELNQRIPEKIRLAPEIRELAAWGCGTTMHVVRLMAPRLSGEDHTKDIDFTARGIQARWKAGYEDTQGAVAAAPWQLPVDCKEGVIIHDFESKAA